MFLDVFLGQRWSFQELQYLLSMEIMGQLSKIADEKAWNWEKSLKMPGTYNKCLLSDYQSSKQN